MCHLRLPLLLLMPLILTRCITAAPSNRYFSPSSSRDLESSLLDREGWPVPELTSNPFLSLMGAQPQRGLTAANGHHIVKRKCNTATCVTQRLADFLVRSSNTIGTVYVPTNVGAATYGKRGLLDPPSYLSLPYWNEDT